MTVERLAMFPLSSVVFPGERLPLHVFEPRYRRLVADCVAGDERGPSGFGIVLITRGSEVGGGDERELVGTEVAIDEVGELPGDRNLLIVRGLCPLRIVEWLADDPYPLARVERLGDGFDTAPAPDGELVGAAERAVARVRTLMAELSDGSAGVRRPPEASGGERVWRLCADLPCSAYDRQRLLVAPDHEARLELAVELAGELGDDLVRMMGADPG